MHSLVFPVLGKRWPCVKDLKLLLSPHTHIQRAYFVPTLLDRINSCSVGFCCSFSLVLKAGFLDFCSYSFQEFWTSHCRGNHPKPISAWVMQTHLPLLPTLNTRVKPNFIYLNLLSACLKVQRYHCNVSEAPSNSVCRCCTHDWSMSSNRCGMEGTNPHVSVFLLWDQCCKCTSGMPGHGACRIFMSGCWCRWRRVHALGKLHTRPSK